MPIHSICLCIITTPQFFSALAQKNSSPRKGSRVLGLCELMLGKKTVPRAGSQVLGLCELILGKKTAPRVGSRVLGLCELILGQKNSSPSGELNFGFVLNPGFKSQTLVFAV